MLDTERLYTDDFEKYEVAVPALTRFLDDVRAQDDVLMGYPNYAGEFLSVHSLDGLAYSVKVSAREDH